MQIIVLFIIIILKLSIVLVLYKLKTLMFLKYNELCYISILDMINIVQYYNVSYKIPASYY